MTAYAAVIDAREIAESKMGTFKEAMKLRKERLEKDTPEPFIQAYSGKSITFLNPKPDQIDIEDIAHTLSLLCRFGGHCKSFYSVAQHSVLCAWNAPEEFRFEALMHDATEAYLVDMPRPIKQQLPQYRTVESKLDSVIRAKFFMPEVMSKEVHEIDNRMLATERRDLMNPSEGVWDWLPEPFEEKIIPWSPDEAREEFLTLYYDMR